MPRFGAYRYPRDWSAFADEFVWSGMDSVAYNMQWQQADNFGYLVYGIVPTVQGLKYLHLEEGNYTLSIRGMKYSFNGIMSWYLDGVMIASGQDWYSAALVYNVVFTASLAVPRGGLHTLACLVNDQNPASGGYYAFLTRVFVRMAGAG